MNDIPATIAEIINDPDTVDFIARNSEYIRRQFANNPEILYSRVIMGRYIIGYVKRDNLQLVMDRLGSTFISSVPFVLGPLGSADIEAAGIRQIQQQPYLNLRGQGVLIGFVDTGIDYTQDVFRYEDGTSKIRYLFDLTIPGKTPKGYNIGSEYTNEQINAALKSENPFDIVPSKDTAGHGTFLASVAAGREVGDYVGAAPDSELIVVKMRKAKPYYLERYLVPPEQENAYTSTTMMVGIEYILQKALELDRPVAICIAMGTNQGSHDGYSLFEEFLYNVSNNSGVCLCTAAGNESQTRRHTQGMFTEQDEVQNIEIQVGEEGADIYINIFNYVTDRISVSLKSPTGEVIARVPAKSGTIYRSKLVLEKSSVEIEYYFPVEGSAGQRTIVKIINATPGVWTLSLYADVFSNGTYHAWLPITGFISPGVEFLSPNPYTTAVVPSTSVGPISCGAYNIKDNSLYINSSWGPTTMPKISPDLTAPGVDVGGYFPTGYGSMSGTSAAAAITTGAAALILQWGVVNGNDPAMGTYQVRGALISGSEHEENMVVPNNQWGYGRLNLLQSFISMREPT